MNCNKCGNSLVENDKFCRSCGAAVNETNAQNCGNYNYSYNQPSQDNTIKVLLIVLIFVVLIIATMFLAMYLNKNNNNVPADSGSVSEYEENKNTTITKKESSYKVKFDGFTFKVPTNLVYEELENSILIGDEDGIWASSIQTVEGVYNQLSANKNKFESIFGQKGFQAKSIVEKTINGIPYITIELSKNGQNMLVGYAKANSMNIFCFELRNVNNEFDYDNLEIIADILNNAEYTGETNNIGTSEKVDLSIVSELAK